MTCMPIAYKVYAQLFFLFLRNEHVWKNDVGDAR